MVGFACLFFTVICDDYDVYKNCEVCFTLKSTILHILWQTHSKRRCKFLIGGAFVDSNLYIHQVLCFISLVIYSDRLNITSLFLLITARILFLSSHLSLLL